MFCGKVWLTIWLASCKTLSTVENCCGLASSLGAGGGSTLSSGLVVYVSKDNSRRVEEIQYSKGQRSKSQGMVLASYRNLTFGSLEFLVLA